MIFLSNNLEFKIIYLPLQSLLKSNAADSLAQQVEHIPFKDGVLGSSPRWITKAERQPQTEKDKSRLNI